MFSMLIGGLVAGLVNYAYWRIVARLYGLRVSFLETMSNRYLSDSFLSLQTGVMGFLRVWLGLALSFCVMSLAMYLMRNLSAPSWFVLHPDADIYWMLPTVGALGGAVGQAISIRRHLDNRPS